MHKLWLLILLLITSCNNQDVTLPSSYTLQPINGRDEGDLQTRKPLYEAKIPSNWIRKDPLDNESIADTTKAIVEFIILEKEQQIKITIHTFPSKKIEERIPPLAQVERWETQLQSIKQETLNITNQSHSGFVGLLLEAEGLQNGKPTKILAWAMQLTPEYYAQLNLEDNPQIYQLKSDFTIKVVGNPEIIDKHREDIVFFADSFETIEPFPSPS